MQYCLWDFGGFHWSKKWFLIHGQQSIQAIFKKKNEPTEEKTLVNVSNIPDFILLAPSGEIVLIECMREWLSKEKLEK